MADVNVYTAKRLNDMAGSLGELARACTDGIVRRTGTYEGRWDCGDADSRSHGMRNCNKCNIYSSQEQENNYYLYYLIRLFEQKGNLDYGDMPACFLRPANAGRSMSIS